MKKVRYMAAAAGVIPAALGLTAQAPVATHTAKGIKSVSLHHIDMFREPPTLVDRACVGSKHRHTSYRGLSLNFYSKPNGSKTCIGTISVFGNLNASIVSGSVHGRDGKYYCRSAIQSPSLVYGCHGSFYRPFSVKAHSISANGFKNTTVYHVN